LKNNIFIQDIWEFEKGNVLEVIYKVIINNYGK
jgi:hypothetical protein